VPEQIDDNIKYDVPLIIFYEILKQNIRERFLHKVNLNMLGCIELLDYIITLIIY